MNPLERLVVGVLRPPARVAERAGIRLLEATLASPVTEQAVDLVLESPLAERVLRRALRGPLVDAVARDLGDRILEGPEGERLVASVLDSHLIDATVARLLENKDLWLMVDVIARSPAVTEAISHQGVGFAEEMAGVVRDRSHNADARVERIARRLLGRKPARGRDA